ncbi:MAG TPA: entericidin [Candidatus Avimuribaculum pullicola]|nr:entericidin [Candidatus Avimuribaculum pullicola]
MKKLVLLLAVVFSVSLFSCGGAATTENTDAAATETVEAVDTTAADTTAADTVAADTVAAQK